jgi:DNA-binding LacI/PurR family transcriptional regulator
MTFIISPILVFFDFFYNAIDKFKKFCYNNSVVTFPQNEKGLIMSVTILEISRKTGFSKSTVHRALSGVGRINPETRIKVMECVKKHNYHPNLQARSLVGAKTFIIGIVVPDLSSRAYAMAIAGVEKVAQSKGYGILIFSSDNSHAKQLQLINRIKQYGIEGFIISPAPMFEQQEFIDGLKNAGIPYVGIHNCQAQDICLVSSGEEIGAFRAVEYLIKLGHQRIGHITIEQPDPGIKHKLDGYMRALKTYGITCDPALVIRKDKSYAFGSGYETTRELLQIPNPPTAIFALSDNIAVGVAKGIKSLGLKIPDDVSLIGYDNKDFTQVMEPQLTTMMSRFDKIGEHAAALLIGKIENHDFELQKTVCIPEPVIRGSCGKAKIQQ